MFITKLSSPPFSFLNLVLLNLKIHHYPISDRRQVGNIKPDGNKNPARLHSALYNFHHKSNFFKSFKNGIKVPELDLILQ